MHWTVNRASIIIFSLLPSVTIRLPPLGFTVTKTPNRHRRVKNPLYSQQIYHFSKEVHHSPSLVMKKTCAGLNVTWASPMIAELLCRWAGYTGQLPGETEGHCMLSKHSWQKKSMKKRKTICFKSVISGWNSFPQCCPLAFWLGAWPRGPRGRRGERLGLLTTFSSLFLYFPDCFSNIRWEGGFRVMAQCSACQSLQSSSSLLVSTKILQLQLLIGNVT